MRRTLLAALVLTVVAAAPAHATPADAFLPAVSKADGVRVVGGAKAPIGIAFDKQAGDVYRRIAGRRIDVSCADLTPAPVGGGLYETSGIGAGFRAPRKRSVLSVGLAHGGIDLCAVSTRRRQAESGCLLVVEDQERWCARIVVARTATGRTRIDEVGRHIDLGIASAAVAAAQGDAAQAPSLADVRQYLGKDVVGLAARDAAPPRNRIGYWTDGQGFLVAATTRAGVRRFMAFEDGVYSTNVPDESAPGEPTLF